MNAYPRLPAAFVRGAGAWLSDEQGKRYLDAVAGVAVCGLGHCHPAVTAAISEQAGQLVHTSNLYRIPLQETLAARLTGVAGMDNAFFCNSGAEANEAALKVARLYGHARGIAAPRVVVMEGSFHGRTLATLSATGNRKIQAGFEPLVQGFVRVPYNDAAALHSVGEQRRDVVAVLVEPIQGEGGVHIPDRGYLSTVLAICEQHGWLMMLDEIQTGMGRTGRWFAFQHEGAAPHVMTLAKSLGNGVPIGACLARGVAAEMVQPGKHGSTFGGNPLACRAALAVLDTLEQLGLVQRAAVLGERLLAGLSAGLSGLAGVLEVRGRGLMLGIELDRPCGGLVAQALAQGLLINVTADSVIRLLPPLVLSDADAEQLMARLVGLVRDFLRD